MAECLFCGIAGKTVPAEIVYEDDRVVAFKDIRPAAEVHVLVIPKEHVEDSQSASPELLGEVVAAAAKLGSQHATANHGFRIVSDAGNQAEVKHLHVHVLGGQAALSTAR